MQNEIWKEPFDVHQLYSHVDPRGFLIELLRFVDDNIPGGGQLYTFSIQPGKRRGDHYHLRKREWFTCVFGKAIVLLSTADGKTCACELSQNKPMVVYAGPGTAHALLNKSNQVAVIVSYGSEQHNPEDEDTYKQIAFERYEITEKSEL
jgi:UDP-2-acetamido-2,6-beta-L-arabino-hexul-4-ose reductase